MNDVDWQNRFFVAPTRWRASKVGSSGTLEFYIQHDEPIYVEVLCPTLCSASSIDGREKLNVSKTWWRSLLKQNLFKQR